MDTEKGERVKISESLFYKITFAVRGGRSGEGSSGLKAW